MVRLVLIGGVLLAACGGPVKFDGNSNGNGGDAGAPDASDPGCGDGIIQEELDEVCDDGNRTDADGCSSCLIDEGHGCEGEPSYCSRADLTVRILEVVPDIDGGGPPTVRYEVLNVGLAPSGPYRVDVWGSRPNGFDDGPGLGDSTGLEINFPSLGPGQTKDFSGFVTYSPDNAPVVFAIVDRLNTVIEQDENNNFSMGYKWNSSGNFFPINVGTATEPLDIPNEGGQEPLEFSFTVLGPVGPAPYVPNNTWFSFNITHPNLTELEITIESPQGFTRQLANLGSVRGTGMHQTAFYFTLTGEIPAINTGSPPYVGEWGATGPWVDTKGVGSDFPTDYAGTWFLRIYDRSANENHGRLNGFRFSAE